MSKTPAKVYERRIQQLKRRRDFLAQRTSDYQGKDMSYDKAELSAIHWALGIIETHYEYAVDVIRTEQLESEHQSPSVRKPKKDTTRKSE